jgi:hypothetical protein
VIEGHRILTAQGEAEYHRGLQWLDAYFIRHLPRHLHESGRFESLYRILRDKDFTSILGSEGYEALAGPVRLWAPDSFRCFPADQKASYWKKECGKPGDWRIVELDGVPPDYIWASCVRCAWVGDIHEAHVSCPECGWNGSTYERIAFDQLEMKYAKKKFEDHQ